MPSPFDPRNALYFGADHLEFCHDHAQLKFPFDPTGTDTDNSNSAYVPLKWGGGVREFTAVRSRSTPSYSAVYNFSFSFADKSVPAFALFYSDPRSTRP